MKFGLMPSSSPATPSTVAISITNLYSNPSTQPSSVSSSRKNSYNNNNNNNINNNINMSITQLNATSDFNQWLHAMKMVARLPGGTPPEFRRKVNTIFSFFFYSINESIFQRFLFSLFFFFLVMACIG